MKWDRSCTDVLCCIIFLVFIASMVGITGYAVTQGDPRKIITPFDSVGNRCGYLNQGLPENKTSYVDYPYKHFTNLKSIASSPTEMFYAVCVSECP